METLYTVGQIFRGGLLKNHLGKPYAHKSTVAGLVQKLSPTEKLTPWGKSFCLTEKQIEKYNLGRVMDKLA